MLSQLARPVIPMPLLAAAGFLSAAGARVVDSLLDVIARGFDVGVPDVAILLAAFTIPYGAMQLIVGPVADRVGKGRVLVLALMAYAAATACCGLASSLGLLTAARACAGAASAGLIPVCLAYVGDVTAYEHRQVSLSRFLNGVVLAQILAGPFGGIFGEYLSWRGVFALLAAAALVIAALIGPSAGSVPPRPPQPRAYGALLRRGRVEVLLLTLVNGVLFMGVMPFVAPFLHERLDVSYASAGLVLACFGLGTLTYVGRASFLLSRLGERGLVLAGGAVAAFGMLLVSGGTELPMFVAAEILLGFGYFMLHSVMQARATEMLPEARSTAVSAFALMLFLGQALGALLAGWAIETAGYRTLFAADGVALLLLGLTLWLLFRRAD